MQDITPQVRLMTYQEADKVGLNSRGLILEYENRGYLGKELESNDTGNLGNQAKGISHEKGE